MEQGVTGAFTTICLTIQLEKTMKKIIAISLETILTANVDR
jgi:hypothetical protein